MPRASCPITRFLRQWFFLLARCVPEIKHCSKKIFSTLFQQLSRAGKNPRSFHCTKHYLHICESIGSQGGMTTANTLTIKGFAIMRKNPGDFCRNVKSDLPMAKSIFNLASKEPERQRIGGVRTPAEDLRCHERHRISTVAEDHASAAQPENIWLGCRL